MIKRATAKTGKNKGWARILIVSLLTVLGVNILAPLASVSADTPTPKAPYVWIDNNHSSMTDGNKTVFKPLGAGDIAGYLCVPADKTVTDNSGSTVSASAHTGSGFVNTTFPIEGGTTGKGGIPLCSNNQAPSAAWVDSNGQYMLIVSPPAGKNYNALVCPIGTCTATMWTLKYGVLSDPKQDIKSIPVNSAATVVAGQGVDPVSNTAGNIPGTTQVATCETSAGVMSWVICPFIALMAHAIDGIYTLLIQPLLTTAPLSMNTSNPTFKVWSTFRIIGDIFLVLALLVIVFGQSLGGGLIDAYSAKKILPRLLAAAVLINISYYIVALAVDVTNIIGGGIQSLLLTPFKEAKMGIMVGNGSATLGITATIATAWASTTAAGAAAASAVGGAAVAAAGAATGGLISGLLPFFILFIVLPALLIIFAILAVVIIRQGLIVFLVLASPIAFALYCLPNTEHYFRKWWDLLLKTLIVYPIMAVLFALGNILSITVTNAPGLGPVGALKPMIAVLCLFVPLFLIPFSFKIAGGVLGRMHEIISTGGKRGIETVKGNVNDPSSLRNQAKFKALDTMTTRQERAVRGLSAGGNSRSRRTLGRALNFGNLQARRSRYNKQGAGLMADQIATGDDTNIRDTLIAYDSGAGKWYRRMDMERDTNGVLKAVPGAGHIYDNYQEGADAHKKAMSLWGGNQSYMQEAMYYEWKKTGFDPIQMNRIQDQYGAILNENGFTGKEGAGLMKGVGFKHAGNSLMLKHSTFTEAKDAEGNGTGSWFWKVDDVGLNKEVGYMIDTYGASKQDAATYETLTAGHQRMTDALRGVRDKSADYVFDSGDYKGKTKAMVEQARDRAERTAISVNPDQRMQSGPRVIPQGEGDAQMVPGMGGISNAPVEVQKAAAAFYDQVSRTIREERRQAPTPSGRMPASGPTTPTTPPASSGSPLILPGDDGFNLPPSQQPRG